MYLLLFNKSYKLYICTYLDVCGRKTRVNKVDRRASELRMTYGERILYERSDRLGI